MNNTWFDNGFDVINDDFFEDIINYLDFPLEDVQVNDGGDGEGVIKDFHLPLDVAEPNNRGGSNGGENLEPPPPPANVLASTVQCDESSKLNQRSSTTEASSRRSVTPHIESSDLKGSTRFQTSSPVSVLESSCTSSAANPAPFNPKPGFLVKGSRSKRRRASSFNPQFKFPLVGSEPESEIKNNKNPTWLSGFNDTEKSPTRKPIEATKCLHCEVTETPQWREGPMGPKTLCNACGVRYRSGRLVPEYRPAASPTFVPSLHSNSHKKVVEMRNERPTCRR